MRTAAVGDTSASSWVGTEKTTSGGGPDTLTRARAHSEEARRAGAASSSVVASRNTSPARRAEGAGHLEPAARVDAGLEVQVETLTRGRIPVTHTDASADCSTKSQRLRPGAVGWSPIQVAAAEAAADGQGLVLEAFRPERHGAKRGRRRDRVAVSTRSATQQRQFTHARPRLSQLLLRERPDVDAAQPRVALLEPPASTNTPSTSTARVAAGRRRPSAAGPATRTSRAFDGQQHSRAAEAQVAAHPHRLRVEEHRVGQPALRRSSPSGPTPHPQAGRRQARTPTAWGARARRRT